ncbi:MAG: sigma-70 family RNA polymerase sigma factor [Longimicrobiaceae bacterium]
MSQERASPAEDGTLVARMAAGDERALGECYDRHGSLAYTLAYRMLGNAADAEEVVADAFAQIWRSAGGFDQARSSVGGWICMITRSRALDRLRTRRRNVQALERAATLDHEGFALPVASPENSPDRSIEQSETRERVQQSLAELPSPQRRVLEMAYFSGLSQSEIAAELNEPLGTVKTRMRAGMEKLRQALRPLLSGGAV